MKRFLTSLTALLLLLGAGLLSSLQAQSIISLKVTTSSSSYQNTMFAGDYAGAPGVRTNNWNNLLAVNGTLTDLTLASGSVIDSGSNVVAGMQAVFHLGGGSDGWFNRQNGSTNDGKMMADVADVYNNTSFSGYGYMDITNIPYTNYNIYCYFRPDNGNGTANTRGGFWLITNTPSGSARIYIKNQSNDVSSTQIPLPSNTGGNYIQSTTTAIGSGGAAWTTIQGGNYGVFSGLTNSWTRIWFGGLGNGTGAKDDQGNYVTGGNTAIRFKLPAFQIYQVPSASPTNLYLSNTNLLLHAGNPAGSQASVFANLADGTVGVSETAHCTFSVDNTNVATVSASGLVKPGTNGTASLIIRLTGSSLSLTNPITVVGPTALSLSVGKTSLLVGNGQGDTTTATLLANFSDVSNVVVNAYGFVSFSGTPGVLTVATNGTLTALGVGAFSVTGTYDQMTVTTNNVGTNVTYIPPTGAPSFGVKLTDATHAMTFHDLSGAPGVRFAYWNNMIQSFGIVTNTLNNPVDNGGNALAGTVVQVLPNGPTQEAITTTGTATTNESTMFDSYFDQGMNNGTTLNSQIVISNVPYSSYDIYFYVFNDNSAGGTNRPGEFSIDGVTQYRINNPGAPTQPDNSGNGYVLATPQPVGLPASVANVPFGNMVKFTSVTDNTLTVSWGGVGQDYIGDAAAVTRLRLAGFQIVKTLGGLHCTNVYLSAPAIPAQLPGSPAITSLVVLGDFTDGTKGGNITTLAGISFSSSNTNVFNVDTNGNVTAGLTPGTATLTIGYQTNVFNTSVTNLAPTSVKVVASPGTVYLDSTLGTQPAQASVVANFPGRPNVNIAGFSGVGYVDEGSPAATLNSDGTISANTLGTANFGASYLGTTFVTTNAFTVASISGTPVLQHLYTFHDATNSTTVVDSVGGANGTIFPPLSSNKPITLDGSRVIFPGDSDYSVEPYIALPPLMISRMGDVSIEVWCGHNQINTWARFMGFGNTPKGTDPHNLGGSATTSIQLLDSYAGTGKLDFAAPGSGDLENTYVFTNGTVYHVVGVCAPNAGVAQLYVNGVLVASGTPSAAYLSTSVNDTVDWLGVSLSNSDAPLNGWINQLAIYEGVLSSAQIASNYTAGVSVFLPPTAPVATNAVPVTFSVSGGNLQLSWPADHLGWTLQTNSVGLNTTNWFPWPGSTSVTNVTIPVSTQGNVYFRLKY